MYLERKGTEMNNKKLYKSTENRVLCGVCGGFGEYFNLDPVVVRIILVILSVLGFSGVLVYIIAALVMPEKPADPVQTYQNTYQQPKTEPAPEVNQAVDAEVVNTEELK